jgi:hypothetical protein
MISASNTQKNDVIHLLTALQELYVVTTDWSGSLYLGMTLTWDYSHCTIDISMPGYVKRALECFKHNAHGRPQHSPHAWQRPQYGKQPQMPPDFDDSTILPPSELTRIQEIVGTFIFYGRAIDSTMLVALGTIASKQLRGTHTTAQAVTQLLNYAAAHPDATVRYHASDMCLHIHSDASCPRHTLGAELVAHSFSATNQRIPPTPPTILRLHTRAPYTP